MPSAVRCVAIHGLRPGAQPDQVLGFGQQAGIGVFSQSDLLVRL